MEPLTTVTIPQDVYIAATASVGEINAACVTMDLPPAGFSSMKRLRKSLYGHLL